MLQQWGTYMTRVFIESSGKKVQIVGQFINLKKGALGYKALNAWSNWAVFFADFSIDFVPIVTRGVGR